MFPEGTRSRGRGLLPFKTGAFHAAVAAGVPVIPVVVSNTHGKIKLNRLNNGLVIVEMLPPIDTSGYTTQSVRKLATHCREVMMEKLEALNAEVEAREKAVNSDRPASRRHPHGCTRRALAAATQHSNKSRITIDWRASATRKGFDVLCLSADDSLSSFLLARRLAQVSCLQRRAPPPLPAAIRRCRFLRLSSCAAASRSF